MRNAESQNFEVTITRKSMRKIESAHNSERSAIGKRKLLVIVLFEYLPGSGFESFVYAYQLNQSGINQVQEYCPELNSSLMMKIIADQRDSFVYHEICCDKGIAIVQLFFICRLRKGVIGVGGIRKRIPCPSIHENLVHACFRE